MLTSPMSFTMPESTYAIADMRRITSSPTKLRLNASIMFESIIHIGKVQPAAASAVTSPLSTAHARSTGTVVGAR